MKTIQCHDTVKLPHLKFGLTVEAVRPDQWVKKGMEVSDGHILI